MGDRTLLENAAKAAGIELSIKPGGEPMAKAHMGWTHWNPLTDDGDALRLAVKLGIYWRRFGNVLEICCSRDSGIATMFDEKVGTDLYAATRKAIVRAAAALGESK